MSKFIFSGKNNLNHTECPYKLLAFKYMLYNVGLLGSSSFKKFLLALENYRITTSYHAFN